MSVSDLTVLQAPYIEIKDILNANLITIQHIRDTLPPRTFEHEGLTEKYAVIILALSEQIKKVETHNLSVLAKCPKKIDSQAYNSINSQYKSFTKLYKNAVLASNEITAEFRALHNKSLKIAVEITALEEERTFSAPKGRKRPNRPRPSLPKKEAANDSSLLEKIESAESQLEIFCTRQMEKVLQLANPQEETNALPTKKVTIYSKGKTTSFNNATFTDPSGLAQSFSETRSCDEVFKIGEWHMFKRIYIIRMLFEKCLEYAATLKGSKFSKEVSAQQAFVPLNNVQQKFFQRAHISPLPQLQIERSSSRYENGYLTVSAFNPNVNLKAYFSWVNAGTYPLDTVLNCVDVVPNYINLIDDKSETQDREALIGQLESVITGKPIDIAFRSSLYKIFNTLKTLRANLKSNDPRKESYEISHISTNEVELFKLNEYFKQGLVIDAVDGMLVALNCFSKHQGPLAPLTNK